MVTYAHAIRKANFHVCASISKVQPAAQVLRSADGLYGTLKCQKYGSRSYRNIFTHINKILISTIPQALPTTSSFAQSQLSSKHFCLPDLVYYFMSHNLLCHHPSLLSNPTGLHKPITLITMFLIIFCFQSFQHFICKYISNYLLLISITFQTNYLQYIKNCKTFRVSVK